MRTQDHFSVIAGQSYLRLNLLYEETSDKPKLSNSLKKTGLYPQKCKNRESQGETEKLQYSSLKANKKTWQLNVKCVSELDPMALKTTQGAIGLTWMDGGSITMLN